MRGQGGNEHGGSPWFQGGVEPGRTPAGEGRELLRPWVDEPIRSLSHRGADSFKLELDISCQRLDSTHVFSHMASFGRTKLMAVAVKRAKGATQV
ncbi:MAG: hypothetical protein ABSE84_03830, partial [Isosphaeraceae bacterium]